MKKLLIAMLTLAACIACNKDDIDEESSQAERTVLIYMAAQNNLTYSGGSRYAEYDLAEIKKGVKNLGDNHLVVYVDKAKDPVSSKNDYRPYLLHFRKGELRDSIPMDSTMLPSDPATLRTVMQRAFSDYPAKDYGLVLWGHATGWLFRQDTIRSYAARRRAYGGSNINESYTGSGNSWMNIPMLAKTLKTQKHLKFIFADCCNMMGAECAYEFKDVCDYFIGSPAEIPGNGAPYEEFVSAFMEKETFYRSILDRYAAHYNDQVPLAVVKSSEMNMLAAATRSVLQAMKARGMEQYPNLSGLIYYYNYNLYDMNHFILKYTTDLGLQNEYQSWRQAVDQTIIYRKFAKRWTTMKFVIFSDFDMTEENFGGMNMFVPQWRLQTSDNLYIQRFGWYTAAGYESIGW